MNEFPQVTVVIPVYNGARMIGMCLDSLMNLDYPRSQLEIIAVDNNSTDGTTEIIKRYPVKYLFEPKRNRGRARNRGIKAAQGELIAFTDADCIVDKDWLKYLVQGFTHPLIAGCGGKLLSYQPINWIERAFHNHFESRNDGDNIQRAVITGTDTFLPYIITANAAFRRKILEEIGLFAEYFKTNEDVELGWRIYLKGYQFQYTTAAIVYHKYRDTLYGVGKRYFESGYAGAQLVFHWRKWLKILFPSLFLRDWIKGLLMGLPSRTIHFFVLYTHGGNNPISFCRQLFLDLLVNIFYVSGAFLGCWERGLFNLGQTTDLNQVSDYTGIGSKPIWHRGGDGKIKVFDPIKREYYQLNETASEVWELMVMENKNLEEIASCFSDKYEVEPDELKRTISEFLESLKEKALTFHEQYSFC